jgi:hypothetical protein
MNILVQRERRVFAFMIQMIPLAGRGDVSVSTHALQTENREKIEDVLHEAADKISNILNGNKHP